MTTGAVSVTDILAARRRLAAHLPPTALLPSAWLTDMVGAAVYLKVESLQTPGSFKIRGALNAALRLAEAARHSALPRLVTASAGNHGRALALAGERLGMQVVVFTPSTAAEIKKAAIRRHGADLDDSAPDYDAAEAAAREHAGREGATFVSPYNHPDVIAGAGTVAMEVFEDLREARALVVPVGGGGLAGGIGLVCRARPGRVPMIGVEAEASQAFSVGLRAGRITQIQPGLTLADGLAGNLEAGSITFALMQQVCETVVTVGEDDLEKAIAALAREEHVIAEGAGAAAVAALAARRAAPGEGPVVAVVSGANIDLPTLVPLLR
jgi:threonine dehydratase